ncbi:hypothetical protein KR054_002491 [Drosophila jambulina]|nr:hypothetical protein KR054_002491 [Drosophila jambulina]
MSNKTDPFSLALEANEEVIDPLDHLMCKNLVIGNPHNTLSLLFKVINCAPRVVLVRPEYGILGPNEEVNIGIFVESSVPDPDEERNSILVQVAHVTELQNPFNN